MTIHELRVRRASRVLMAGALVVGMLTAMMWAPPAGATEAEGDGETAMATFEGEAIPMDEVWAVAEACVMWPDETIECFRTVEEREEAENERPSTEDGLLSTMSSTLSSSDPCPVRLYALTYYGGTELTLTTRWQWHNLSLYGFSNRTSSFKLNECSATFRDGSNGSGTTYPGSTSSWTWSTTMAFGWDNRVSSVWIH